MQWRRKVSPLKAMIYFNLMPAMSGNGKDGKFSSHENSDGNAKFQFSGG